MCVCKCVRTGVYMCLLKTPCRLPCSVRLQFDYLALHFIWMLCGFWEDIGKRVPLVEQELLTLPANLRSPSVFSGVCVTRSLVLCVMFVMFFFLYFFFWPLHVVSPSILITHLVSSNSYYTILSCLHSIIEVETRITTNVMFINKDE